MGKFLFRQVPGSFPGSDGRGGGGGGGIGLDLKKIFPDTCARGKIPPEWRELQYNVIKSLAIDWLERNIFVMLNEVPLAHMKSFTFSLTFTSREIIVFVKIFSNFL